MGLLTLAALLRSHGYSIAYIDCLNRFHPQAPPTDPSARCGRGPYLKTRIARPPGLQDVPRNYSRYGIKPQWFQDDLRKVRPPDLILITSLMTYWYPGVQETIRVIREVFPQAPIVLGGIYASLCRDHAVQHAGADRVLAGAAETAVLKLVEAHTGLAVRRGFDPDDLDSYPYPALDLQDRIGYVPLLTSRGCPFDCAYCAARFLNPKRLRRRPEAVVAEIDYWHQRYGVMDFILYDDAFLVDAAHHAIPLLEKILARDDHVRFHTPNAVHIRGISRLTARLMFQAGFHTLRLGLETTEFSHRQAMDHNKVTAAEFKRAVGFLREAGFARQQVGAYLLVGLPGQSLESLKQSIATVRENGITPVLAHYSPIPHTALWDQAVQASRYDLASDPIFTNNAIFPCRPEPFAWRELSDLKQLTGA
ncbi:MAG: B12-binding domain-containing radical SAM protein [Desulfobacterales bacterium]|nr:MAG: B12-binding domain-containing radical SAM protein [Desulfobacterales bacterium]